MSRGGREQCRGKRGEGHCTHESRIEMSVGESEKQDSMQKRKDMDVK